MGIITKQSIYNIISIGFAFMIGAVNMLFLYPSFPGKEFQGLIIALLANSNLYNHSFLLVFNTLIKFFSNADSKEQQDRLLWFSLFFPLLILILLVPFYIYFNEEIS